jgi:hypothetical protein
MALAAYGSQPYMNHRSERRRKSPRQGARNGPGVSRQHLAEVGRRRRPANRSSETDGESVLPKPGDVCSIDRA